ncbi:MAG: hypothetical protein AAGG11_19300 [Pseudomonadota bacterium]
MFRLLIAPLFCLTLLFSSAAAADDAMNQPMVIGATAITVKPSGMPGIEAMAKAYVAASRQLESERHWTTWRQLAGNPNQLMFIRTYPNFAAMDEEPMDPLTRTLGVERAQEVRAAWTAVEQVQTGIWRHSPQLSVGKPSNDAPGQSMWLQIEVAAGQEQLYMAYLDKVAEATRKVMPEANYQTFMPVAGEPQFWVFAVDATYAQMDQNMMGMNVPARLKKAFGAKEAARLAAMREKAITDAHWVIAKADAELSYWPEAPLASR